MASITIISGCLGTGKTTLAKALADAEPAAFTSSQIPFIIFRRILSILRRRRPMPKTPRSYARLGVQQPPLWKAATRSFSTGHIIETTGRLPEDVRAEYLSRRRRHEFVLDPTVVVP
jgi:hypothetical protein